MTLIEGVEAAAEEGGSWFAIAGAAILMKLVSSVDDLVWLLPFMVVPEGKAQRWHNAIVYITINILNVGLCVAVAVGGKELVGTFVDDDEEEEEGGWGPEKILTAVSGGLLCLYALYLVREWCVEEEEDEDEEEDEEEIEEVVEPEMEEPLLVSTSTTDAPSRRWSNNKKNSNRTRTSLPPPPTRMSRPSEVLRWASTTDNDDDLRKALLALDSNDDDNDGRGTKTAADGDLEKGANNDASSSKYTPRRLTVVAIFGSIDEFALFVSLLLGDDFEWSHLIVGVLVGCWIILGACYFTGFFRPVVAVIERIPLFVIIGSIAIYTIVEAATM